VVVPREYCAGVARAIVALDKTGYKPGVGKQDGKDWDAARELLYGILSRNGYELCEPGSVRIQKRRPTSCNG
jgi:hypothetical protein